MSTDLPPLRVPEPAFMAAWPRGIRPASVRVAASSVRLLFVHPDAGWVEAWVQLGGRAHIGLAEGFTDEALQRLVVALRARWNQDAPISDEWLGRAIRHRAAALAAHPPIGVEGSSDLELAWRVLGAASDRVAAVRGFETSDRGDEASCAALACEAFLLALSGRGPEARPLAVAAAERAVGMERPPIARLLSSLGAHGAAADCLARGLGEGAMPLADVAWVAGLARRPELARTAVRTLLERADATGGERRLALDGLVAAGQLDEAIDFLAQRVDGAPSTELFERLAELHLWRLELEPARRFAERAGETPLASLVLGAAHVLEGDHREGLDLLARIDGEPGVTARLWRMRAMLELGREEGAIALAKVGAYAERVSWKLWRAYAEAHTDPETTFHGKEAYQVRLLLESIHGAAVVDEAYADHERALALVRRTIERLGGNYGPVSTWLDEGKLQLAELVSPRAQAMDAQLAIPDTGMAAAFDALDAQARTMPSSPFGRTYRAELLLWTGRHDEAEAEFEAIWNETKTRWGYVGLGAARLFAGRADEALKAWEAGLEHYDYLPAEATFAYRGEAYLAMDRVEEARAELEHATTQSPSRVGAWAALALARLRSADHPGARDALDRVAELAPALLVVAAEAAGVSPRSAERDALEGIARGALDALGGNRASKVFTFRDGRDTARALRAVPARHWVELAKQLSALARDLRSLSLPFAAAEG